MRKHVPKLAALALAAVTLASCTIPIGPGGTCPAPSLQYLVGQPEFMVSTVVYAGPRRVIHPGDMVTMDYRPNRLNFRINTLARIESITCG